MNCKCFIINILSFFIFNGIISAEEPWTTYRCINTVYSIAVEGKYVWCGTDYGVVCWNTVDKTYVEYILGDHPTDVNAIAIDSHGNKWFGTWDNGVFRFDGETWEHFTTENGLAGIHVFDLDIDTKDNIWTGTFNGVSKYDGETWTTYTSDDGLAGNFIRSIGVDSHGIV